MSKSIGRSRSQIPGLTLIGILIAATSIAAQTPALRKLTLGDVYRLREVSAPELSPDGGWVAYTVGTTDSLKDRTTRDLFMSSWDGRQTLRLTTSPSSEGTPRWSPDGRYLAFLSDREDPHEVQQVWLLNREGGEAERITNLPGGVSQYAWSPDSKRLALIASDPDPDTVATGSDTSTRRTPPIVINRFQFKEDETGYLGKQRDHLYVLDLASRKATLLMPGSYNELAPSWSPDGQRVAFASKRQADFDRTNNWDIYVVDAAPGATPTQLTTFPGPDMDPEWGGRGPAWSPDGKYLAYVQGGSPKLIYYAGQKLAVVPAGGGPARVLTPTLDRNVLSPRWSADGSSILFLLEDDRVTQLASVPAQGGGVQLLTKGRRLVSDYSGAGSRVTVLASTPGAPAEVFALDNGELRPLSRQNDGWLRGVQLAPVEEISFRSRDGTAINGFLVRPVGFQQGKPVPTILRIHGGPVYQFSNEFAFEWQLFAAEGFAVVAANPRGSSGRGEKFSTAIWADWGNKDGQDVLAAVDYAVAQGVADSTRLGVGGWSYGGMLTDQVIARDRRFKAAISGAGQGNALAGYGTDQYVREYEAELGTPWANTEAWLRVSYPFFHADRIVTPTLFMCGDKDFNVPLLNSEQMYQALKSLGRDTELVIYPGEYHEIKKPSYERDRLQRYVEWYGRHLKRQAEQAATH
ncbi:MAG: prolyl oligopeptidase family serine peptidase [Gemmatimonadales bacterium]